MRIAWKKVLILAVAAGLLLLLLRGILFARTKSGLGTLRANSPDIIVYDHRKSTALSMPLETYLIGVTAAEMPASFPIEALKAQSVAARTYTLYHMLHNGCKQHDADVCTDSGCCQAYLDDARRHERWGSASSAYAAKVEQAVLATSGCVMLYDGAPIEALYHSASGGRTENVEDVYSNSLPYLRSVMSTAEAGTARLSGRKELKLKDFCTAVNARFPEAKLTVSNAAEQTVIEQTTPSGRVQRIRFGRATATGREARGLFGLDSALFTIQFIKDAVIFETKGYGHGVGMSQTGANVMALGGADYAAILHYYYTDITLGQICLAESD